MKNSFKRGIKGRENFLNKAMKCHLSHFGAVSSARYKHLRKAHHPSERPTEGLLEVCWLLSVILKECPESAGGPSLWNTSPRMITSLSRLWKLQGSWAELGSHMGFWAVWSYKMGQGTLSLSSPPPPPGAAACVTVCLLMVQEEPKLVFPDSAISEDNEIADRGITVSLAYCNSILYS